MKHDNKAHCLKSKNEKKKTEDSIELEEEHMQNLEEELSKNTSRCCPYGIW